MEGKESADPLEIDKSPEVIKDAQEEIGKLDVLVCGKCHDVFHYIEQLQEHQQSGKCTGVSMVRENYKHEPKPQVWAFMLWKNAQFKKTKEGESMPTSWTIYQRWCKLDPEEKDTWVVAGQSIQSFTKISTAKMQEIKAKTQPGKNRIAKPAAPVAKSSSNEDDTLEEGEIRVSQLSNAQRVAIKAQVASNKANREVDPLADGEDSEMEVDKDPAPKKNNEAAKKVGAKPAQVSSEPSSAKKPVEVRKGLRTCKDDSTEEAVVEKIINRRINQKKKCVEYFIKWENLNDTENTWEPKIHLDKCKTLVEEFDRTFNKSKMALKKLQAEESRSERRASVESEPMTVGRPQRTSKQKALNQVKVWCGDITDGDEASGKRKSFSDDGDSSDSFEKKIKLEEESDTSEDEKPSVTIRRIVKNSNSLNGVPKRTPDGSLSTTQRVVRVSQKQLPSLSSGVYIMSKTEGIIKLDSNTAPAGSPLLKVGPKIGQTHIKVVKKDAGTSSNMSNAAPRTPSKSDIKLLTSTPKPVTKVIAQRKIPPAASPAKTPVKVTEPSVEDKEKVDSKPKIVDEDSDGLEELEFPTDLPLPEPDSPPGEFTLCPLTGKILGQASEQEDTVMENATLDSLVKLATADLPDVDMDSSVPSVKQEESGKACDKMPIIQAPVPSAIVKPDPESSLPIPSEPQMLVATITDIEADLKHTAIQKNTSKIVKPSAPTAPTKPATVPSGTSILNAALTHARVTQAPSKPGTPKKLLSTPSTVRQKVTVNRPPITRPTAPRPSPTTTIIHKISPSRHRPVLPRTFNNEPPVLKRTSNVTTYKPANVARRIGNTTIYKTEKPSPSPSVAKVVPTSASSAAVATAATTQAAQTSGSTVISMPLLSGEEEPTSSSDSGAQLSEIESLPVLASDSGLAADLSTFSLPDSEAPLLITGDDGTIYQVAGQNEEGQTILISEGPDGQQQCVIVSSENSSEEAPVLMADGTAEPEQVEQTEQTVMMNAQSDADADGGEESQVVAQIIKADPPSPGGTRKVVLMLPDGNLMMTDVTAEQYAALELDK